MSTSYTRRINLYINGKEVRNDISSIRKEMNRLQREQAHMIIGSKEYVAQGQKIKYLKGIMAQHNAQLRQTKQNWFSLTKTADAFNRYFAFVTATVAALVGLISGFRRAADASNVFEERLDNLSALTGLEGRNLQWLSKTAKDTSIEITESNIRIKQSAADILDAYTKVGSQRPELLKVKEDLHLVTKNAIILSEAAKMKLEPSVAGLTTAMNQLHMNASQSGRIINAMAAGSKLGAATIPYLTTAIEKSGTTFHLLNLEIEDNIALIETIAPNYHSAEEAGTSLDRTLLKMKAEGIGFKNGVFDVNQALEELKYKFDHGVSAVDLFGLRHAKMAEVLVQNRAEFKRYREGVTDTNIAFEQAAKNTNNRAAQIQQAKNRLQLTMIDFGEKLSPAYVRSTNAFNYFLKALVALPKIIRDNQILIISLAGAYMAYKAAVLSAVAAQAKKVLLNTVEAASNAALVLASSARVAAMQLQLLFLRKQTAAQVAHVASLKKAIMYEQLFGKALSINPVGLAIIAITSLVIAIKSYDKYSKQAVEREKHRKKAIEDLTAANKLYSETQAKISEQMNSLNRLSLERKKQLKEETEQTLAQAEAELLLQEAKQKAIAQENTKASLWQQTINALVSGGNAFFMTSKNAVDAAMNGKKASDTMQEGIDQLRDRIQSLKKQDVNLSEILDAESIGDDIGTGTLVEMEEKLSKYQTALQNTIKGSEDYIRVAGKIAALEKEIASARQLGAGLSEDEQKKKLEELTAFYDAKKSAVTKDYLDGKISRKVYDAQLLAMEINFHADKLKIYKKGSAEYEKAYLDAMTKQAAAQQKLTDLLLKAEDELRSAKIENLSDGLAKELASESQRWALEKRQLDDRLIEKSELSDQELQLNETTLNLIREKQEAHDKKMQELRDAQNLTDLDNQATALEPYDSDSINLEALKTYNEMKLELINAQYEQEKKLAGDNQSALLLAESNYNRRKLALRKSEIEAESELTSIQIGHAKDYVGALIGIVDEQSVLGKALAVFHQALAITQIWIDTAKTNAVLYATALAQFAYLGPGAPAAATAWAAAPIAANNTNAAINTGLIAAQTIASLVKKHAAGGFTEGERMYIAGEAGTEWIAPNWMVNHPSTAPLIQRLDLSVSENSFRLLKLSPLMQTVDLPPTEDQLHLWIVSASKIRKPPISKPWA